MNEKAEERRLMESEMKGMEVVGKQLNLFYIYLLSSFTLTRLTYTMTLWKVKSPKTGGKFMAFNI